MSKAASAPMRYPQHSRYPAAMAAAVNPAMMMSFAAISCFLFSRQANRIVMVLVLYSPITKVAVGTAAYTRNRNGSRMDVI